MPDYIVHPIEVDEDVLLEEVLESIQLEFPNWTPHEGNFEVILLRIITRLAAEGRTVASGVLKGVFRYWGTVIGLFPLDAIPAHVTATLTLSGTTGWTIPQGTTFSIADDSGVLWYFETDDDYVVLPLIGTVDVNLIATVPGAGASGLTAQPILVTAIDAVASVSIVDPTSGGQDAESDDEYLQRIARALRLMKQAPVLAEDYALDVLNVPGVYRAGVRDNFEPPADDTAQDVITMSLLDETGEWVGSTVDAEAVAYLEAKREQNFSIFTVAPDYTVIDITYTATAEVGWDATEVEAAADLNAASAVSPAVYGTPENGEAQIWELEDNDRIYYHEVSQAINNTPGLRKLLTLQIRETGGTLGVADVVLPGFFPLPRPGVINGTVT